MNAIDIDAPETEAVAAFLSAWREIRELLGGSVDVDVAIQSRGKGGRARLGARLSIMSDPGDENLVIPFLQGHLADLKVNGPNAEGGIHIFGSYRGLEVGVYAPSFEAAPYIAAFAPAARTPDAVGAA